MKAIIVWATVTTNGFLEAFSKLMLSTDKLLKRMSELWGVVVAEVPASLLWIQTFLALFSKKISVLQGDDLKKEDAATG